MASVGSKNTAPELAVRRLAHRLGYRFRLHRRDLPGTPDLAFPQYRTVVQVNGCFWHGHEGCRQGARSRSNTDYWGPKIEANRARDARTAAALGQAGWAVVTVWGCEIGDETAIAARLRAAMPRKHFVDAGAADAIGVPKAFRSGATRVRPAESDRGA